MLKIDYLVSGGIITNYKCTSVCKHCCYSSSPNWSDDYMTAAMADEVFSILRSLGCYHVHIGGGEPLLKPDKILDVLDAARKNNIEIEYIETNSSWYRDETSSNAILKELKAYGVNTLLISIDPFHNEYIPFWKVKALIEACSKAGMKVFPWLMEFWDDIDSMDDEKPHSLDEYKQLFGHDYMMQLLKKYGLNLKGRAFKTYKPMMKRQPFEQILNESIPCKLLSGIYHFHIDLYGNFIPQSCPGFSIPLRELAHGADSEKYRIFNTLESVGIRGFVELAEKEYRYKPREEYAGKCDLCYDMRNFLVLELGLDLADLKPVNHYKY
ncbi:radical SAM protein [Acetivibrio clariflavus]|uniref:Radical SAM superfamily enzyme n=1 Tax=Acetivibrio clariflavus (strain DSM 19732 / NBRC 101661 / EBR45) TaxID=720554 RepID=G8LYM9_ACECE|nr:radical SAM protein [Acetivibrio clariflavus]AEV70017.1 radical SAM superfamily enzyme [Acetivibrio clariflavus DSM 19732]HOQ38130.1 radical SAM protein [Acetivibrio sp.]